MDLTDTLTNAEAQLKETSTFEENEFIVFIFIVVKQNLLLIAALHSLNSHQLLLDRLENNINHRQYGTLSAVRSSDNHFFLEQNYLIFLFSLNELH